MFTWTEKDARLSRPVTCKLLDMIKEGVLDRDAVIEACLDFMSEDQVAFMARAEGFIEDEDEDAE